MFSLTNMEGVLWIIYWPVPWSGGVVEAGGNGKLKYFYIDKSEEYTKSLDILLETDGGEYWYRAVSGQYHVNRSPEGYIYTEKFGGGGARQCLGYDKTQDWHSYGVSLSRKQEECVPMLLSRGFRQVLPWEKNWNMGGTSEVAMFMRPR